jgi:hypothetical protein
MDILFVLLGIAIFYAAAAVFAIEHYEENPAQAALSFLVPPFGWWLYSHYWEKSKQVAYAQIIALILIIGGGVMMKFLSVDTLTFSDASGKKKVKVVRVANFVGSDESLRDLANANQTSDYLNGRIRDKHYLFDENVDVAEFDRDGVLRIKYGKEFYGDLEIAIAFNAIPPQSEVPWTKVVRKEDANAPVIYVSWFDEQENTLKSLKYDSGYNLDFRMTHVEYNFFTGYLQLVLPDPENSFLVGEFPAFSSRLRFHGEGIIKTHDSKETLEVIANQTLSSTYRKYVVKVFGFSDTDYDYRSGEGLGSTNAYIQNKKGIIKKLPLNYYKNENGWFLDVKGLKELIRSGEGAISSVPAHLSQTIEVDFYNMGEVKLVNEPDANGEVGAPVAQETAPVEQEVQVAEVAPAAKVESKPEPQLPSLIKVDVATQQDQIESLLKPLVNKDVELETTEGKLKKGVYVGVHRKQLVLEIEVGGGVIEYLTKYPNLKKIRVLNNSQVRPQQVDFFSSETP